MLLFKKLNKKVEAKKANFLTSLILNSYYAVLILPSIFSQKMDLYVDTYF